LSAEPDLDFEDAFNYYWEGDEDDNEPITDVSRDRAKEIFLSGYLFGRRKPVYQMSAVQYQMLVRLIREQIEKEKK
jgi:hypothetical protein